MRRTAFVVPPELRKWSSAVGSKDPSACCSSKMAMLVLVGVIGIAPPPHIHGQMPGLGFAATTAKSTWPG
jgi:hypothetical protein